MRTFVKDSTWRDVEKAFVKVDGVWRPVSDIDLKNAGTWKPVFMSDRTIPPPPVIGLDNIESKYLTVNARLASSVHNTTIKRIRVLITTGGYAPNQFSTSGYYAASAVAGGTEPFSDFYFNGQGGVPDGRDTTKFNHKRWNPSLPYTNGKMLANNTTYYAAAWTEGINGQWSAGSYVTVKTPKKPTTKNQASVTRVSVRPLLVGTVDLSTGIFTEGVAEANVGKAAVFYYGDQITRSVEDSFDITDATLEVKRMDDGGDRALSESWVGWTDVTLSQLNTGSNKLQYNNLKSVQKLSPHLGKDSVVKIKLPTSAANSSWRTGYRTQMTALVLPMHTQYSAQTFKKLYSQSEYPYQGQLALISSW